MNFTKNNSKLYNILGINKSASSSEIKKAYRKLAMKWHPDRNKNNKKQAEEKFKEIGKAYEILSNPEKRKIYEKFGEEGLKHRNSTGGNPFDIFEQMFSNGNPFGNSSFGNMFNRQNQQPSKGPNKKVKMSLSYKYIMLGGNKSFSLKRQIKCTLCKGHGCLNTNDINICKICKGKGQIIQIIQIGPGMISQSTRQSHACNGKGKTIKKGAECRKCKGIKCISVTDELNINIKKGTKKNEYVVIKNKADYIDGIKECGDLIIIFDEINQENLSRSNNDLLVSKDILLSEALLGLNFIFEHPNSTKILLKYNDIIKPNTLKVVHNLGFPIKNTNNYGNLMIKFNILFPDRISDEQKNIFNNLLPKKNKVKLFKNIKMYNLKDLNVNSYSSTNDSEDEQEQINCAQQ